MKYGLFYGTLRKPQELPAGKRDEKTYNFDRFGEGTQKYIKTLTLDGYEMYDLGYYPAVSKGDGQITVELHEVDDRAAQRIAYMEQGAGYEETKVQIDGVEASLYAYTTPLQDRPKIESGDWVKG